jgi:hypothetical protein
MARWSPEPIFGTPMSADGPPPDPRVWSPAPTARAAAAMFVLAGVNLMLGTCVGTLCALVAMVPLETLLAQADPAQHEQLRQIHPLVGAYALGLVVIFVGPGVAELIAGFFVRRGSSTAIILCMVLAGIHCALSALFLVSAAVQVAVMGFSPDLIFPVALSGCYLFLLIWTLRRLYHALWAAKPCGGYGGVFPSHSQDDLDTDPWRSS